MVEVPSAPKFPRAACEKPSNTRQPPRPRLALFAALVGSMGLNLVKPDGRDSNLAKLNKRTAKKIYTRLQEGQIRLVYLHPPPVREDQQSKVEDGAVTCSLASANLNDNPTYQALSYVWGEQTNPRRIRVNGEIFYVTRNLYEALDRLRRKHEDRIIWIDALAINQSNIPERNSQVQLMRSIYSRAQETLIWLHEPLQYCNAGLWRCLCENDTSTVRNAEVGFMLRGLVNQTYWLRVWTAQEVRYSRQATLMTDCGKGPFDILTALQDLALTRLGSSEARYNKFDDTTLESFLYDFQKVCLAIQPRQLANTDDLDFGTWTDLCSLKDSSDPRDLVFGFWGCFPPDVQHEIRVDYSLSPAQVLTTCKQALLQRTSRLDFLGQSNFSRESNAAKIPSWDPELRFNRPWRQAQWAMSVFEAHGTDQSDQRWGPEQKAFRELLDDAKILHVKGRWLGEVAMAAKSFPFETAYGERLLTHFVGSMRALDVKEEEIEDFARVLQPPQAAWLPDLSVTLTRIVKSMAAEPDNPGKVKDHVAAAAELYKYSDFRQRFVYKVSTVMRIRAATDPDTFLFGMTWIKEAEPGDKVCLVQGCSRPLILRPQERKPGRREEYTLIGAVLCPGPGGKSEVVDELVAASPLGDIYLC